LSYYHSGRASLHAQTVGFAQTYRAILAGDANMSVEVRSDIAKYIFDVVQGYLAGRRDYPKWVVIRVICRRRKMRQRCWRNGPRRADGTRSRLFLAG
jgi:hypothetical protein